MSKIFVTGGAGYVGSVAVKELCDRGHQVLVFDDLRRGHRAAVDPRAEFVGGNFEWNEYSTTNVAEVMGNFRPDAVMHFAAYALVGESMTDPLGYFRNNVCSGISLLEAMEYSKCDRIIFSSSCATFGTPSDGGFITEDTPQDPTNPYGESKLMFEKVLKWQSERKRLKATILRYFNAAGAVGDLGEDHDPETHLIPNVLKAALGRKPFVEVFGSTRATRDGSCERDYVHVGDLAMAHAMVLEKGVVGAYNLGTGRGFTVKEVVESAKRITGKYLRDHDLPEINVVERPDRPGDPDSLVADPSKAKRDFGWEAKAKHVDDIMVSAWDWHRAHPDGYPKQAYWGGRTRT